MDMEFFSSYMLHEVIHEDHQLGCSLSFAIVLLNRYILPEYH